MSISNPLLKQLKGHILALTQPDCASNPDGRATFNYAIPVPSNTYCSMPQPHDKQPSSDSTNASASPSIAGNGTTTTSVPMKSVTSDSATNSKEIIDFCSELSSSSSVTSSINNTTSTVNSTSGSVCNRIASIAISSDSGKGSFEGEGKRISSEKENSLKSKHSILTSNSCSTISPSSSEFLINPHDFTTNPADFLGNDPLSDNTLDDFDEDAFNSPITGILSLSSPKKSNASPLSSISLSSPKKSTSIKPSLLSTPAIEAAKAARRAVFPCIDDSHPALEPLCSTMESILCDGLEGGQHSPFGYSKTRYWDWMRELKDRTCGVYPGLVDRVVNSNSVRGAVGRGRLLIRHMLVHGCLQVPLHSKDSRSFSVPYSRSAILGHEILTEILLSLVRQLDLIRFQLDLDNAGFLEDTWQLPLRRQAAVNTRLELGLHVAHVAGRCVVLHVDPGGAAANTGSVRTGDVLSSINGVDIRGYNRSRVTALLKQATSVGDTVHIVLTQGISSRGEVFPPVLGLLRKLGVHVEEMRERRTEEEEEEEVENQQGHEDSSDRGLDERPFSKLTKCCTHNDSNSNARVWFVGAASVGCRGDVALVDVGVTAVLMKQQAREPQHNPLPVHFVTGEIGVNVTAITGKFGLQHSYTEISACGRRDDHPLYFAYIAGDTTCSISDNFTCYVFKAATADESSDILLTLADGFHRTHWAV